MSGDEGGIERLRDAIADVDRRLVELVVERMRLARTIGDAKRRAGLPVLDPAREAAVLRAAARDARAAGLDEEGVRDLFWQIVGLCRESQQSGEVR